MLLLALTIGFGALMLLSISLLKVYRHVPEKELKRQARAGDELAKLFYRVVAYGMSLDVLLSGLLILSSSALLLVLSQVLAWPIAFLSIAALLWFGFDYLPKAHLSSVSIKTAKYVTPPLHWVLERLQPLLLRISLFLKKRRPVTVHTGLYTKQDIVDLITSQKVQIDNRVTKEELHIVEHALQFGERMVSDVMTPRRAIKSVAVHDMIGPVLLEELHKSGHSRFPVYKDSPDDIVGTLYIRDALAAKAGGFVKDVMRHETFYVHQDQTLARVLDAFIKTKHHQFLVVNNFEEIVGLITIEDVIEQVIGKQIIDEFDAYDDLRAVAAMDAQADKDEHDQAVVEEHIKSD